MSVTGNPSKVYLVGAGPGNPCLLSKKAERCIQQADVILYDQLVHPFILQLSRPDAEWIHVGKTPYTRYIKQERINELLVEKAHDYQRVVRLKGGDPAIFGRVTEEVDTLREHGIDFEIIPGITAASAAISQLGRGLTERQVSTNITFTTGHFKDDVENEIDITTLENGGTLAIYMGVKRLPLLMDEIMTKVGIDYPVAVIFNATRPNQQVIGGTVTTIAEKIAQLPERPGPGVTIVGEVVRDVEEIKPEENMEPEMVLLTGERTRCIDVAYDIFEKGGAALIDDREVSELHPSQHEIMTAWLENYDFTSEQVIE
ncbi:MULTISPECIES: uroporphyrinogen-III C-methyltransferase [unclassified Staphylococcus]|uniref:uroporphyrinogen-III C-methyltransferase n=1 Tax=unclassified Staphylococcus TaxID=91994 RepID=UPI0021CF1C3F|nr:MULTISPECIES: uroporphyrinogen-III C-methyltransferase [unclassified Staphylococcus]UXR69396.1 uroporphyrinogen-III C-methyltransferase [Staphylococcus sp. IVB6246]UXR71452.1 uroporphyrinogen-III C-methyltransferase [Staphylococcus sp. IVB6240]UXR73730.1 uroporphyrinogen-III C-methyltransferase [Staphylococcus sp. IVB6238]UXR76048.1 uroporphyrinogen-III C-methyltransferase [Staphylococcus sp. IVB6233]UXR80246.1 uroporphyrinogen-III C-methyltransferase [Staphylococcus sp. IVB6218]